MTARTSADLMNLVRHELGLSDKAQRFPLKATCLAIYSRAVNAAEPLDVVLGKQFPWCAEWKDELRRLFAAYVEAKQTQHVLDYDDLLLYWGELMGVPELAAEVGALFDHVLVDEYQDTNALQAAILLRLKPDGAGLTVVGDDAQAIYGFRAASVRNILDFPGALPAAGRDRHAGAELPLDAADPGRVQRRHRPGARALHQEPALAQGRRREARHWSRCSTTSARSTASSPPSWRTARPASPSRSRRCCSARRTTAPCSRSS